MATYEPVLRKSSHILAVLIFTLGVLTGCSGEIDSEAETKRLNEFVDEQYLELLKHFPEDLVRYGLDPLNSDWRVLIDAQDEKAIATIQKMLETIRNEFAPENLTEDGRITLRMWDLVNADHLLYFKWQRNMYPISQMSGIHADLPDFMINFVQVNSPETAEAYVSRLEGAAVKINQTTDRMIAWEKAGVLPPKFVFPKVIADARNVISGRPFQGDLDKDSVLYADLKKKIGGLEGLDEKARNSLIERGTIALSRELEPAYQRMNATLKVQGERATTESGVWKLPDGEAYYKSELTYYTTDSLDAETIHQIGLDEVARIHVEMQEILKEVGFDGTLNEFFEFIRTDERFTYPDSEEGRAAYIARASEQVDRIRPLLPSLFGTIPSSEVVVRAVEKYRENSAGTAFYNVAAPDGSRPGIYYVNMKDMTNLNKTELATMAFHEALPGHHLDGALSMEQEDMPLFRKFWWTSSYGEGWAHYAETLANEAGLFDDDPYSRFGYLNAQIYRAIRLIVDTGIHAKKWTREEAIQYYMDNMSFAVGRATKEIERYIVWPGQATSYKIGQLKILELRERARARLGDDFDIRMFHDQVLGNGPVPLDLLEELIDDWIEEEAEQI